MARSSSQSRQGRTMSYQLQANSLLVLHGLDPRFLDHLLRQGVGIAVLKDDLFHARIDDHLRADAARLVRAVERCAFYACAVFGGLDDGVLLGMEPAAYLVPLAGRYAEFFPQASAVIAVLHAGGSAIIPCGEDIFVLHDNGPDLSPEAGGAPLHKVRDLHKIFIPGLTYHNSKEPNKTN